MNGPTIIESDETVPSPRIGIVISEYNTRIINKLLEACLSTLESNGVDLSSVIIAKVPGAFEIPMVARKMAFSSDYDVVITLGAIIRGETPHFEYIANCCSQELMSIGTESQIPVIFGVLTVDNIQQAIDRSGDEESNKGAEAARTALDMVSILRKLSSDK
jgi:6,7-dimethyl-8-ribityllumazine synthase